MTKEKEWKPFVDTGREAFLAETNPEALRAEYPNSHYLADVAQREANRKMDAHVVKLDLAKSQRDLRFKFELLDHLGDAPTQKRWLVKNVIALGETSAWIAPPGGLKSALLAELAFSVAAMEDWHGYKTKMSGSVVYFALERSDLVKRRLRAYMIRSGLNPQDIPAHIAIVPGMVDLMNPGTIKDVMATIRAVEAEGPPVFLSIFDTFAKLIAAGGGDENLAKDQGKVFANVQRIKDASGCHVALVGHTGKDEGRGARGSNALLGDVDVMVTISGEAIKTATVTKANDMPEGPLFSFTSEIHEFGKDEDGDPITVNIISAENVATATGKPSEPKLSTNQRVMYRLLAEAGAEGLTVEAWNDLAKENGIATKQRHYEIRMALKDKQMVREYAGKWKVHG